MSFRRNREQALEWHKRVETHQDSLIAIGIPREVWEDRSVWQHFPGHGYSSDELSWRMFRFSPDDLDEDHLRQFHLFLDENGLGTGCVGSTVGDELARRFGNGD